MDSLNPAILALMIPIVAIVGGLGIAFHSNLTRARQAEAKHEERMAMIEQGMHPDGPELEEDDPERGPKLIEP